jgi:hypothetical protein
MCDLAQFGGDGIFPIADTVHHSRTFFGLFVSTFDVSGWGHHSERFQRLVDDVLRN